jgi:outer membrane protein assembly factor BamA
MEGGLGYYRYEEDFMDAGMLNYYGGQSYNYFLHGNLLSASASLTGETTFFKEYGPAWGNTFRLAVSQSIPVSKSFYGNTTLQLDARQYLYIGGDALFAFRFEGFASRGEMPFVFYWGGNNQVRSSYFYNIIAHEGWFANAEFRFPLINIASTILGSIGPVRGVLFFDITRSKIKGYPPKFYEFSSEPPYPVLEYDAIGSYGYGIEFFLFGLPMHIDFAKRLNFPRISRPFSFEKSGDFRTNFWIGYDF